MLRAFFLVFFIQVVVLAQDRNLQNPINRVKEDLEEIKHLTSIGNYPEAYDKVWNVLIVADSLNNPEFKYQAYGDLSLLYSIFHNRQKAIAAIDSMFVYAKQIGVVQKPKKKANLYYCAALTYRMNHQYKKAKEYLAVSEHLLDSLKSPLKDRIYVLTEKAHIYTLTGAFNESDSILNYLLKRVPKEHHYVSIIYSMLGDLYVEKKEPKKALAFYNKCLKMISERNIRVGLKVELIEKISKLNNELGNYQLAFKQMTTSKVLGDSLFGSQSYRNKQLFEIKDSYRKSIIESLKIQKEQELQLVKAQKEKLNSKFFFSVLLFIVTVIAAFFGLRLIRKKHETEKKLATERSLAEVEIKKKELAVTALQLIEKDKLLEEIKKGLGEIKKDKEDVAVEQLKSTIKVNTAKTWEEFEARFVQVNSSFYESLGKKHPDLSRNELKLCALVKLNFSTKEMSQLLGVSADSINKARYRLRKKLGLQREENLGVYINSI